MVALHRSACSLAVRKVERLLERGREGRVFQLLQSLHVRALPQGNEVGRPKTFACRMVALVPFATGRHLKASASVTASMSSSRSTIYRPSPPP